MTTFWVGIRFRVKPVLCYTLWHCHLCTFAFNTIPNPRDRPKFSFSTETSDFSFSYGPNREAWFQPTFGYGRNYDKVST